MKKLYLVLLFATMTITNSNLTFAQRVNVTPNPPGTPYATLQLAFNAVMAGTHGATPTITVVADYNDATGAILSPGTYTSVIITASGNRFVGCTGAVPLITFNNVDNSTINGTAAGGTLTLNLQDFGNNNIGGVKLVNGSSGNTIKNIAVTTTSLYGKLIYIAQSTTNGAGNNNNIVESCTLTGGGSSLESRGTVLSGGIGSRNLNTIFRNNSCIEATDTSILLGREQDNITCQNNTIDYPVPVNHLSGTNCIGISCHSSGICNIKNNVIKNFRSADPFSTYKGINLDPKGSSNPSPPATTINTINNCITLPDILLLNADFGYGIACKSEPNTVVCTANIYNNTCRIAGFTAGGVVAFTAAILIDNKIPGSIINSYNNICANYMTGGFTGTKHVGYDLSVYPYPGVSLNSDYNLAGGTTDAAYNNNLYEGNFLKEYKNATCADLIEQHTSNDLMSFIDTNSCIFTPGTVKGNICGKPLAAVTTDIFGTSRNSLYPFKGCYEGATLKILTLTLCLESKVANGEIQVYLYSGGGCSAAAQCFADADVNTNTAKLCYGDAISNGTAYRLSVTTINHLYSFSNSAITFASGTAAYNFLTSRAII